MVMYMLGLTVGCLPLFERNKTHVNATHISKVKCSDPRRPYSGHFATEMYLFSLVVVLTSINAIQGFYTCHGGVRRAPTHLEMREGDALFKSAGILATSIGLMVAPVSPALAGMKGNYKSAQEILAKEKADKGAAEEAAAAVAAPAQAKTVAEKFTPLRMSAPSVNLPKYTKQAAPAPPEVPKTPVKVAKYAKKVAPAPVSAPTLVVPGAKAAPPKFKYAEEGAVYYAEQARPEIKAKKAETTVAVKTGTKEVSVANKEVAKLTAETSKLRRLVEKTKEKELRAVYAEQLRDKEAELASSSAIVRRGQATLSRSVSELESVTRRDVANERFIKEKRDALAVKVAEARAKEKAALEKKVATERKIAADKLATSVKAADAKVTAAENAKTKLRSSLESKRKALKPARERVKATSQKLASVTKGLKEAQNQVEQLTKSLESQQRQLAETQANVDKISSEELATREALDRANKAVSEARAVRKAIK